MPSPEPRDGNGSTPGPDELTDPVEERRALQGTESRVAIQNHPLHAMLVAFPIALTMCVLGADLLYWWTGEGFWPVAAGWAAFGAFALGVIAGITGTIELLIVPGIRNRSASWTHFVLAVMLLSILGANWVLRIGQPEAAVLPFGLLLSALAEALPEALRQPQGRSLPDVAVPIR